MLKVDAADASLMMGGSTQSIEVEMVEQVEQGEASTAGEEELDTAAVAERVRHYLKFNQIQWTRFGALVLGVSQGRLSTLLGKPKPWHQLAPRVRALYQRMQLWMNTKATYGNNPYMKVEEKKIVVEKKPKMHKVKKEKRRKSLFDASGSSTTMQELLEEQRIQEEQRAVRELNLMEEQVVVEEQVIDEVMAVEELAEQVVIDDFNMEEIVLGTSVNLGEVILQVKSDLIVVYTYFIHQDQTVSLMVAEVDPLNPDSYTLALL